MSLKINSLNKRKILGGVVIKVKYKLMAEMCTTCGLPNELCVCEDVAKSQHEVTVVVEERKFNDVTIAKGFDNDRINISELESELKSKFACGGTIKNNTDIELQGNHYKSLIEVLEEKGFIVQNK